MAIIGTQDSRDAAVTVALALDADSADIAFLPSYRCFTAELFSA
jgi:hypothetical protein